MYVKRLRVKNYRSIKTLDLTFTKGKNVIVGKNNCGKSNIVKALDIILGEPSPTFHKSENICENDFYNGQVNNPIYIYCELSRDKDEKLNYDEIYKCIGFKYHVENKNYDRTRQQYIGTPVRHHIDPQSFWDTLECLMNIDEEEVASIYVNPKLRHQASFEDQLNDKYCFAYIFKAYTTPSGRISKSIRFLYREDSEHGWILSFTAPIRCEFLQSAILPSFRDPSLQLRISSWTWYGKLLRQYINTDNEKLQKAFAELRDASDDVFDSLKTEINNSQVKVAFPETEVSFQFNPETNIDIYKSALIYVDDGFNTLLQEKGSGIQSAVIIGLFHYYTTNIAHAASSLLVVEEPELYLHPQARRVISYRLTDFLENGKNQVIVTTHAPEFITSVHEDLNLIVIKKNQEEGSTSANATITDIKEKQIF